MANTSDFRNGLCLELKGALYTIIEFQHVKPGKGGAFVRTKLKNLKTGKVIENTFNAGVKINTARIEHRPSQFLYKTNTDYHFMDDHTFETITLDAKMIVNPDLLKEGEKVTLIIHEQTNQVLSCQLPHFVILKVTYTEPGVKGDTATKALKKATLETGAEILVPLFIENEDEIKIGTKDRKYEDRHKKK
ncbi:MAG: elongation factor P [Bacteroidota bacterium]